MKQPQSRPQTPRLSRPSPKAIRTTSPAPSVQPSVSKTPVRVKHTAENILSLLPSHSHVYLGTTDTSYRKNGLGVLLDQSLCLVIGMWCHGKLNGPAIMIYADGTMLSGRWKGNKLEERTVGVMENQYIIRAVVVAGETLEGLGLQYDKLHKSWRVLKYHQGVQVEVIKQMAGQLDRVPSEILVDYSLSQAIERHIRHQWFQTNGINVYMLSDNPSQQAVLPSQLYHKDVGYNTDHFGLMLGGQLVGPGAIIERSTRKIKAIGLFTNGILQGFGCKQIGEWIEIGFWKKGQKEGSFLALKNKDRLRLIQKRTYIGDNLEAVQDKLSISTIYSLREHHRTNFSRLNYQHKNYLSISCDIRFKSFLRRMNQASILLAPELSWQPVPASPNVSRQPNCHRNKFQQSLDQSQLKTSQWKDSGSYSEQRHVSGFSGTDINNNSTIINGSQQNGSLTITELLKHKIKAMYNMSLGTKQIELDSKEIDPRISAFSHYTDEIGEQAKVRQTNQMEKSGFGRGMMVKWGDENQWVQG